MAKAKHLTEQTVRKYLNEGNACTDHFKDKSLFVELPCKVGQTIFFYTCVCDKVGEEKFDVLEGEVISFSMQKEGLWAYCRYKCGLTYWHIVDKDFGKTVFLTKEEAEAKLKEMEE
jgi:hypothetical protein